MREFELTPRRAVVLTALLDQPGHEIQDPDGQATALLMTETGHRTTNALSGVMMHLEQAGLIERDVSGGRRTYRIALTRKGVQVAKKLAGQGADAEPVRLPPTAHADEVAAVMDGAVDLDLLAGVLLKKALIATQAQEDSAGGKAAARAAEAKIAQLEAELREARSEVSELRAQVKTLEHNNKTLMGQMDKVKKNPGRPISELVTKRELADLDRLMRSLPSARG